MKPKRVIATNGRTVTNNISGHPWLLGELLLFLGEIEDMPGHGIFVRNDGKIYFGFHIDEFIDMKNWNDPEHNDFESELKLVKDPIDKKFYFCMSEKGLKIYSNNDE